MADLLEKILRNAGPKGELVLRGELEPRERRFRIVSVDDQLIEPPGVFTSRMPAHLQGLAPRV